MLLGIFNSPTELYSAIFVGLIIIISIIILIAGRPKKVNVALSNWRHYFTELGMPAKEFFDQVKASVDRTGIPDIEFSTVIYRQGGIFSPEREYFRISRNEYVIDICASPFGKAFFVSYWKGKTKGGFLSRIPIIRTLLGKDINYKTYYQLDTEAMFNDAMHSCITGVCEEIAISKGIRGVSELERQPVNYTHNYVN
jgi:hypothetical protein